jgi:hypothetical protein
MTGEAAGVVMAQIIDSDAPTSSASPDILVRRPGWRLKLSSGE